MSRHPKISSVAITLILSAGLASPGASQTPDVTLGDPVVVFGGDGGNPEELLGSVAAVTSLGPDLWAIGDGLAKEIHIVDGSGALVRTLGGDGDGPGEFRILGTQGLWALPDGGLGVWDPRAGRVTYFRGDAFEEVETVAVQQVDGIGRPDLFIGATQDGLLIASTVGGPLTEANPGPFSDRHEVGLFGSDGSFMRKVADLEGFVRTLSGGMSGPIPFSPYPMVARGLDRVAFTNGGSAEIAVLTGAGTTEAIRVEASEPSNAARERAWRELDALAREPDAVSGFWLSVISTVDRSVGSVPVIGAIVGGLQSLWVQTYEVARHSMPFRTNGRGAPGGTWDVYDWAGNQRGTVRVPDDFTPVTVHDRWVAGIRTDELGVESFAVYPNPF